MTFLIWFLVKFVSSDEFFANGVIVSMVIDIKLWLAQKISEHCPYVVCLIRSGVAPVFVLKARTVQE